MVQEYWVVIYRFHHNRDRVNKTVRDSRYKLGGASLRNADIVFDQVGPSYRVCKEKMAERMNNEVHSFENYGAIRFGYISEMSPDHANVTASSTAVENFFPERL
jgi:hypothetical protein